MVRVGDGLDDRQSQSVSTVVVGTGAVEALEGFEETLDLFGVNGGAGVGDSEDGAVVSGRGGDLNISAGGVVADCVVEQVGDQALEESWIAGGWSCGQRCAYVEIESGGF